MAEAVAVWCGYADCDVSRAVAVINAISVVLIVLIGALVVPSASQAECQTNQTVSGQEICEEEDATNGAYNLMER